MFLCNGLQHMWVRLCWSPLVNKSTVTLEVHVCFCAQTDGSNNHQVAVTPEQSEGWLILVLAVGVDLLQSFKEKPPANTDRVESRQLAAQVDGQNDQDGLSVAAFCDELADGDAAGCARSFLLHLLQLGQHLVFSVPQPQQGCGVKKDVQQKLKQTIYSLSSEQRAEKAGKASPLPWVDDVTAFFLAVKK